MWLSPNSEFCKVGDIVSLGYLSLAAAGMKE
jgi:hypothetical protein